ncbi:MAG: hypothetical protein GXY48_07300 [Methanomicrobiales archaeon]|nr:hypothetical protein [Methanomicrobiales archaeon]
MGGFAFSAFVPVMSLLVCIIPLVRMAYRMGRYGALRYSFGITSIAFVQVSPCACIVIFTFCYIYFPHGQVISAFCYDP